MDGFAGTARSGSHPDMLQVGRNATWIFVFTRFLGAPRPHDYPTLVRCQGN
jgi:hypothetical protein